MIPQILMRLLLSATSDVGHAVEFGKLVLENAEVRLHPEWPPKLRH